MPVYKCPKCGRTVYRKVPGIYYCRVCGSGVIMENVELTTRVVVERPPKPDVPRFWVFTYPECEFIGSAATLSEAVERAEEQARLQTGPVSYMIVEVKRFVEAW